MDVWNEQPKKTPSNDFDFFSNFPTDQVKPAEKPMNPPPQPQPSFFTPSPSNTQPLKQ